MTGGQEQFSGASVWGQAHLALDAIVAFVDEELSSGARRRALSHLAGCGECASEVVAQTRTRLALRSSAGPTLPSSLLHTLRNIPIEAELSAPPAGLAVGPDGQLVSMLRPPPARRGQRGPQERRAWFGTGALVTGLAAVGALVVAGVESADLVPEHAAPALDAQLRLDGDPRGSGPAATVSEPTALFGSARSAAFVPAVVFDR